MKNLAVALALVFFTGAAQASTSSLKFVSVDNSVESQLCIIAAEEGYSAALSFAKKSNHKSASATTCNGQNIKSFSKTYQVAKNVVVVPANNNQASKFCAQAVKNGLSSIITATDIDLNQMRCNGQKISNFVKKYSKL